MLILGCGNSDRGDDGAGPAVIRGLRELGIDAREQQGDVLALIESWAGADEVVLLDATVSGTTPGTITVWNAAEAPVPAGACTYSTHGLGVAEAVELARVMGRLPARLVIYGIEAAHFEPGAPLSHAVAEAVERVVRAIAAECEASPGLADMKTGAPKGALE